MSNTRCWAGRHDGVKFSYVIWYLVEPECQPHCTLSDATPATYWIRRNILADMHT